LSVLLPLTFVFAAGWLMYRCRMRRRRQGADPGNGSEWLAEALLAEASLPTRHSFHVFMSYRRIDFAVCDLVAALLELEGVRVFKDRAGHMAGRPFDEGIARAIMDSATFAPVVTLAGTEALLGVSESSVDYVLVEYILALHFRLSGQIDRIYPLLVGVEETTGGQPRRDLLQENEAWRRTRAQLPDVVPLACIDVASALLRIVADEPLAPCLRRATVRELLCASAGGAGLSGGDTLLGGILTHDWCVLTGLQQDMALYIRKRFAAHILGASTDAG